MPVNIAGINNSPGPDFIIKYQTIDVNSGNLIIRLIINPVHRFPVGQDL
jgi:hypothetical protein